MNPQFEYSLEELQQQMKQALATIPPKYHKVLYRYIEDEADSIGEAVMLTMQYIAKNNKN